jgi:hypothetical protein
MIDSYLFGRIKIDGEDFTSDVIIFPNRVKSDWWRKEGHTLNLEDIRDILKERPDVLIVGTGRHGLMSVPSHTRKGIEAKGIELMTQRTGKATKTFNKLCKEKKVVVALHLTC